MQTGIESGRFTGAGRAGAKNNAIWRLEMPPQRCQFPGRIRQPVEAELELRGPQKPGGHAFPNNGWDDANSHVQPFPVNVQHDAAILRQIFNIHIAGSQPFPLLEDRRQQPHIGSHGRVQHAIHSVPQVQLRMLTIGL